MSSGTIAPDTAPLLHLDAGYPELDMPRARRSALLRTAAVGLAVVAALPYSLSALVGDFQYASAMGEIVLVPVCAFALALVAAWRHPWIAALRPGRADLVLASAAVATAAGLVLVAPVVAGNLYYAMRPDLLAVPLLAAAATCLLLGVRALLAFAVPLLLSTLTWPLPLRAVLEPAADVLTGLTAGAVRLALHVLPLATPVAGPGDLRLAVEAAGGTFDVVLASACSGMTGIGGTLLVGCAAQYVLHGTPRARALWLTTAVALAWVLNLGRILLLLGVGRLWGERVAFDVVHPVAGLLLLNVSFAVLLLAAPAYGLRFSLASPVPADTPLTAPAPVGQRMGRRVLARRAVAVAAGAALLGTLNAVVPATAGAYDDGDPAAAAFSDTPAAPPGFTMTAGSEQTWSRLYFGAGSSWKRYRMTPTTSATGFSFWVDAVTTPDWAALHAHPLLDCYRFHGFDVERVARRVLTAGVLADEVVFSRPDGATWHVLSWEWPVTARSAGGLQHERVVLLASSERTDLSPAPASTDDTPNAYGAGLRSLLASGGRGEDPNPGLAAALRTAADGLVTARILPSGEAS